MGIDFKSKPYIIAEAATNHNGNLENAFKLVDIASLAGADSVKFQIINPERLYIPQIHNGNRMISNEVIETRRKAMLSYDDYTKIKNYCDRKSIDFSASVFDGEGLEYLISQNPKYIKIASCDLNNIDFIKKVLEKGLPIILSVGMSTLNEIERTVKTIKDAEFSEVALMHCVSVYPAPLKIANLGFIDTLKKAFGFPVGFSDHTRGSLASCVAVAKGAVIIEKHFTYDSNAEGIDHANSIGPDRFKDFIKDVCETYQMCLSKERTLTEEEIAVSKRARRSLYASRDIGCGERIGRQDILIVRPESFIKADQLNEAIGKILKKEYKKFEPLKMEDME